MKEILLTQGKVALVDDEDYDVLNEIKWYAHIAGDKQKLWYATHGIHRKDLTKTVLMHRIILNAPPKMEVDHIDGNGLNNQKLNLRLATRRQNCQNLHIKKTSKYPGVMYDRFMKRKKRWKVNINIGGIPKTIGHYHTEEEAYQKYMEVANNV
jgi:hypothetical protein